MTFQRKKSIILAFFCFDIFTLFFKGSMHIFFKVNAVLWSNFQHQLIYYYYYYFVLFFIGDFFYYHETSGEYVVYHIMYSMV